LRRIDEALALSPDARLRAEMKFRLANFLAWGAETRLEDAELACRQAVELFEQAGDERGVLLAATEAAFVHGLLGNLTLAGEEAETAALRAEAAGHRDIASRAVYVSTLFGDLLRGRFEAGEAELRRSMDIAHRSGQGYQQFQSSVLLGILLAQAGSMDKARAVLQEGRAAYPPGRDNPLRVLEHTVDWSAGDFPAALASGREWVAGNPAGMGGWPFAVPVLLDLAELAAEVGDGDVAGKAARRLGELAEHTDRSLYRALAQLAAAFAALARHHDDDAAALARAAADLLEGSGYRAFFGRALDTLGRALSSNDPEAGRAALRRAAATFHECGAVRRAALAEPGREMRRPPHAPGSPGATPVAGPAG
jgi:hypothetical protein